MNFDDLKIYKGQSYSTWYAIEPINSGDRWLFLCYWKDDQINFTQTQCVLPTEMFETSWLELLAVRGITKEQVIQWIKDNTSGG